MTLTGGRPAALLCVIALVALTGAVASPGPVPGTYYAVTRRPSDFDPDGPSGLVEVNPIDGYYSNYPGAPMDITNVQSMTIDPATGVFYVGTGSVDEWGGSPSGSLYSLVDPFGAIAAGQPIPTNLIGTTTPLMGTLAIDPSNGQMYGASVTGGLYRIDKTTAATTHITELAGGCGPPIEANRDAVALAFDPDTGALMYTACVGYPRSIDLAAAENTAYYSDFGPAPPISVPDYGGFGVTAIGHGNMMLGQATTGGGSHPGAIVNYNLATGDAYSTDGDGALYHITEMVFYYESSNACEAAKYIQSLGRWGTTTCPEGCSCPAHDTCSPIATINAAGETTYLYDFDDPAAADGLLCSA